MRFFSVTPRIVIGENSSVSVICGFLASGHHCPGMTPGSIGAGSVFYFYFAAPSADLAFGLAGGALAAAFGGALSLRTVPQGSVFCCSGMLPSDLR